VYHALPHTTSTTALGRLVEMHKPATSQQHTPPTTPYRAHDHLIKIKTKDGPKDYYPAAWRLYELHLRFEEANFSSDLLLMDAERDLAVVKCRLYLGPDYQMSHKKTEALKSGPLSQLDQVESAAKAECARDFGCGTEYALVFIDDHELMDVPSSPDPLTAHPVEQSPERPAQASNDGHAPVHTIEAMQAAFAAASHIHPAHLAEQWAVLKASVLGASVADQDLSDEQLARLHRAVLEHQQQQSTPQHHEHTHRPALTAGTVQAFYAKTYRVKPDELEAQWSKFVAGVVQKTLPTDTLTGDDLLKLNYIISQEYQRRSARSNWTAA
jgi:hypothetical protein